MAGPGSARWPGWWAGSAVGSRAAGNRVPRARRGAPVGPGSEETSRDGHQDPGDIRVAQDEVRPVPAAHAVQVESKLSARRADVSRFKLLSVNRCGPSLPPQLRLDLPHSVERARTRGGSRAPWRRGAAPFTPRRRRPSHAPSRVTNRTHGAPSPCSPTATGPTPACAGEPLLDRDKGFEPAGRR
jgi:hypothetical protein